MTLSLFAAEHNVIAVPQARPAPPAKPRRDNGSEFFADLPALEDPDAIEPADALLKWVGGKRTLVAKRPDLFRTPAGRVHIPCVGGGALVFMRFPGSNACLSDINERLVNAYLATQADARRVASEVNTLVARYERARAVGGSMDALAQVHAGAREGLDEGDTFQRAAKFFFVVIWGFNGLYRENSAGQCNTPHGDGKFKTFSLPRLLDCQYALRNAEITRADFETALANAVAGDFAYLDVPYAPVSKTASFTSYTGGGSWGHATGQTSIDGLGTKSDRQRLVELLADLDRRGVDWTLSDADTPETAALYASWNIERVAMARNVNSKGDKRAPVSELVVRNWR